MGKSRECAESCIDYLTLTLVQHYRAHALGPSLHVSFVVMLLSWLCMLLALTLAPP
jgi:hypothetical protein